MKNEKEQNEPHKGDNYDYFFGSFQSFKVYHSQTSLIVL